MSEVTQLIKSRDGEIYIVIFFPLNKWILVILVTFQLGYIIVMALHPNLLACLLYEIPSRPRQEQDQRVTRPRKSGLKSGFEGKTSLEYYQTRCGTLFTVKIFFEGVPEY